MTAPRPRRARRRAACAGDGTRLRGHPRRDAPPSLKGVVAHPGADWGGDVLIAGGAVWLAGSVSDGAGGTDSSLTGS